MSELIAVPCGQPGGLDAVLSAHFGHCDLYTLIKAADGQAAGVEVIPNMPHAQGGCLAPVQYLADKGVTILLAGGMGLRPLMGFNQAGIKVLHAGPAKTVGEAVNDYLAGQLVQFSQQHTCGGGAQMQPVG